MMAVLTGKGKTRERSKYFPRDLPGWPHSQAGGAHSDPGHAVSAAASASLCGKAIEKTRWAAWPTHNYAGA